MPVLGEAVLVILFVIGIVGLFAILHVAATGLRDELAMHDLRVRMEALQRERAARLQAMADPTGLLSKPVMEVGEAA